MPKQAWDMKDDRRLRNALGSQSRFESEDYYDYWVSPHACLTNSSHVGVQNTQNAVQHQDGSTVYARHMLYQRENWTRGNFRVINYLRANTNTGDVYLDTVIDGQRVGDSSLRTILNQQETITVPGTTLAVFTWEVTGSTVRYRTDGPLLSFLFRRQGGQAADTMTDHLYFMGALLRWEPFLD